MKLLLIALALALLSACASHDDGGGDLYMVLGKTICQGPHHQTTLTRTTGECLKLGGTPQ